MSDSTDAALAAEGDHEAFQRLYRRYLSRIYSLCVRLSGSPGKGTQLTEEVFVRAWQELPHFTGESGFGPWLQRLATEVTSRWIEGQQSAVDPGEVGQSAAEFRDDTREAIETEKADLAQAIERLPAAERKILVLHDVEGYKYEELAEILGTTIGGTKARLHRARVLLSKELGQ